MPRDSRVAHTSIEQFLPRGCYSASIPLLVVHILYLRIAELREPASIPDAWNRTVTLTVLTAKNSTGAKHR